MSFRVVAPSGAAIEVPLPAADESTSDLYRRISLATLIPVHLMLLVRATTHALIQREAAAPHLEEAEDVYVLARCDSMAQGLSYAAFTGDSEYVKTVAENFHDGHPFMRAGASEEVFTSEVLHAAVATQCDVSPLLERMHADAIVARDRDDYSALHLAAMYANATAYDALVRVIPDHRSAISGHLAADFLLR